VAGVSIYRYQMIGRSWTHIGQDHATAIASLLSNLSLSGPPGAQFGVQQCEVPRTDEIAMVGVFVHEVERQRGVLTPDKAVQPTTEPHAMPFIFATLPNLGYVSLQARRLSADAAERIVQDFSRQLIGEFGASGFAFEGLEKIETGYTREEYLEAFFSPQTERVVMVSLSNFSEVPPADFPFFNPNFELNQMARRANDIDRRELKDAQLRAKRNGNLKHSPTARGLMQSSAAPRRLEIVTAHGPEILESSRDGRIVLNVGVAALRAMQFQAVTILVTATAGHRQLKAQRRRRGTSQNNSHQQPLFDQEG
jgi:hypothetical protein